MTSEASKNKGVSTTLTALLSNKTNKICADCRSALVNPLLVHASFCPGQDEIRQNPQIAISIHDFTVTHQAFAPPSIKKDPSKKYPSDPAMLVNQKFGGHGVFLCPKCADAHRSLGPQITLVQPVLSGNMDEWTPARTNFMMQCGGNSRSWTVYEAYMPEKWKQRRPTSSSGLEERIVFVRAKYEALAFTMPPPGRLAEYAWLSILERNEDAKRFVKTDLKNIHTLTPSHATISHADKKTARHDDRTPLGDNELPNRLIDFFCVVSSSMHLHPNEIKKDLSELLSPEELEFWPHIQDCYPEQDFHNQDTEFPGHLPSFVLPDGCRPSLTHKAPTFFTFVLTTSDGDRLYGGSLQIYDDAKSIGEVQEAVLSSGYEGSFPRFLQGQDDDAPEIVFFSKSLVLLSHYPFFDLFRTSLKQLNLLTLVEAPLPIERYISNICREVPLPPQGNIKVEFGFTPDRIISIERPPNNDLPMTNFSFRPLFSSLSVGNIIVVLGCLMEECKVVLLSNHYSMLCPVAEALLGVLFPFEWQGIYIPIMPYSMLDLLDAPVPFLLGMSSRYLREIDPKKRPRDLVFVDLDRDVVQLGIDDATGHRRKIPTLPARDALKLRATLEEHGGSAYMLPTSGIKGCIMSGITKTLLVVNEERPKYARMESVQIDEDSLGRNAVFDRTDKAYDETKDLTEIQTQGHMKNDEDDSISVYLGDTAIKKRRDRLKMKNLLFTTTREKKERLLDNSNQAKGQGHLLDIGEPKKFNTNEIRKAFLRLFVSIFINYEEFLLTEARNDLFDEVAFLDSVSFEPYARDFVQRVIQTQMFQRFLEERKDNPMDPEFRFFDESIIAKINRSKKAKLAQGGKKLSTPFLDDEGQKIIKTFTPPPPSNLGLPDNETTYQYGTFPTLDYSLFGRIRPTAVWHRQVSNRRLSSLRSNSLKLAKVQKTQRDIMKKAVMKSGVSHLKTRFSDAAKRSVRDLETALTVFSPKAGFIGPKPKSRDNAFRKHKNEERTESSERYDESNDSDDSGCLPESVVVPLSRADTLIINARRKQAILLDVVIKTQATCRMYLIRKQYTGSAGKRPQREGLKFRSACQLQRHFRGFIAYQKFQKLLTFACLIQKNARARRNRLIYAMVRNLVCNVQAHVRGILVRKRLSLVFAGRMKLYRSQLYSLWNLAFVPLALRTKMWPTIAHNESFSRLRLCESEIIRLIKVIGLKVGSCNQGFNDPTIQAGASMGMDNGVYLICKSLSQIIEEQIHQKSSPTLEAAEGYENAERLQLYERLDSQVFANEVGHLYELFSVPKKEKKKLYLAQHIWNEYEEGEASFSTMMLIFPELEGALNIVFHDPTPKSRRRFTKACKVITPPVQRRLWDEISLEENMKKHIQEVARMYMTKVPILMAKLDEAMDRKKAKLESYKIAAMKVHGTASWKDCRRKMISDYLEANGTEM